MSRDDRRPLILLWSDPWISVAGAKRASREHCRITTDRDKFERADAVVFPMPTMGALPRRRAFRGQVWVLWSQESEVQFPALAEQSFAGAFDIRATYRLDSDVPIPYAHPTMFDRCPEPPLLIERRPVPVSAWISSKWDRCGRDDYLRELMRHIAIDSYGKVAHNADLADDRGAVSKLAAIAGYRFTLAFENSIAPGYVTEKLYQPLLAGSVPIYRGAPDVHRHLPAPHCCVNADDFAGPRELAEFLHAMTDKEYLAYHAWRDDGPTDEFSARFEPYRAHAFVRLARMVNTIRAGRTAARRISAG
jgi:alpha-1,3-fucosyltransferase 10